MMDLDLPAPRGRIRVRVDFNARKRITIRIHPDGSVRVTAPLSTDAGVVERLLLAKRPWIAGHLERLSASPRIPAVYVPGGVHFFLGRPFTLEVARAGSAGVTLDEGRLLVSSRSPEDSGAIQTALRRWYRRQAETIICGRVEVWAKSFPALPSHEVRFRWMRSRWGSCARSGLIVFNTQLVKTPMDCVDYVVAHELCHLVHHDHGAGFRELLDFVLPRWRDARRLLKKLPLVL